MSGLVVFLTNLTAFECRSVTVYPSAPVFWRSRVIKRICRSTLAAECLAAADAVDRGLYISEMLTAILPNKVRLVVKTDCRSLVDTVKANRRLTEKRLAIDVALLAELLANGQLWGLQWVATSQQLADALTKRMSGNALLQILATGRLHATVS